MSNIKSEFIERILIKTSNLLQRLSVDSKLSLL